MFESGLSRLDVVHEARTPEEREAVYAFRYTLYVEELGRELGGADHVHGVVRDDEDEAVGEVYVRGASAGVDLGFCYCAPGRLLAERVVRAELRSGGR